MDRYKRSDVVVLINSTSKIFIINGEEKTHIEAGSILKVCDQLAGIVWLIKRTGMKHQIFTNYENLRHATPAEIFLYEKHLSKTGDPIMSPIKPMSHESEK